MATSRRSPKTLVVETASVASRNSDLEAEVAILRENLSSMAQVAQLSSEELRSSNEELQSMNEELQSTNEEITVSKEEAISLNADLLAGSAELLARVESMSQQSEDMNNLLEATEIATIFLDADLRLRRFTNTVEAIVPLIPADVGRPMGDIVTHLLDCETLLDDVRAVIATQVAQGAEVQTRQGRWFQMRAVPYRMHDEKVRGAVLTFSDISSQKELETGLRSARQLAEAIVRAVPQAVVVLDEDLRVSSVNRAFSDLFGIAEKGCVGRSFLEVAGAPWGVPDMETQLQAAISGGTQLEGLVVKGPSLNGRLTLSGTTVNSDDGGVRLVLLAEESRPPPPGCPIADN